MEKFCIKYFKRLDVSSSSVREEEGVIRGEDRLSLLPESLLCHILSFLTTEQAVWTSVLSSRWRFLWKSVPRLELDSFDFTNHKACVDFIEKFLDFQSTSYLREFKLTIDQSTSKTHSSLYEPCLGRVTKRKIQHVQVETDFGRWSHVKDTPVPLSLSVCEALVCLKLHFVRLNDFESLSLPCLKIMYLDDVIFPNDAAAETLISCSPVLEVLKICLSEDALIVVLRVYSQSLKSFTLKRAERVYLVMIDTPKLEYLSLMEFQLKNFEITSIGDSVKVDIDVEFGLISDYLTDKKMYYNFLNNFSGVKDMTISWKTLKFIFNTYHMNPLLRFNDLTRLRATMCLNASAELLPIVLESCPNLKHFTLELVIDCSVIMFPTLSTVLSRCLVSSLESVEMESPITEIATELELARYFLENSTTLKKLVLRLNQSSGEKHEPGVLEQLIESPRCSTSCQFEVLPVVPTPTPRHKSYQYPKPTTGSNF